MSHVMSNGDTPMPYPHAMAHAMGRAIAHSPSPFPLPPVSHPSIRNSLWGADRAPRMDGGSAAKFGGGSCQ